MTGIQDMILVSEIVLQSKIAGRAVERLQATHDKFDHVETWCSIQSILVAAGNVSKILWPTNVKYKQRGENLRRFLSVEDGNLLSSRKFRNHFEHYDERVDSWFEHNPNGAYVDLAMNPSLMVAGFPGEAKYVHRGYNAFDGTLVFRGELIDLNQLLQALDIIRVKCKQHGFK